VCCLHEKGLRALFAAQKKEADRDVLDGVGKFGSEKRKAV